MMTGGSPVDFGHAQMALMLLQRAWSSGYVIDLMVIYKAIPYHSQWKGSISGNIP